MTQDQEKKLAAEAAVALVEDGMTLGLGTGSTAAFALRKLGALVRGGLKVTGVPTSQATRTLAQQEGIPLMELHQVTRLDLTLDGADEFDPGLNLIKGGGGALYREKIIAAASDRLVIFADTTKQVEQLGAFPLPVEVNPFGWTLTAGNIEALGAKTTLRQIDGSPFKTDNQGYVLDCDFGKIPNPMELEEALRKIVGVNVTGLFVGMAEVVLLARDGAVQSIKPIG